jgi:cytochrome oxidase Cu insertion factor (SCO1/SenC/PrrC family)
MKKSIFLFVLSVIMYFGFAQTTLTTAVDFTVTDTKGVSHNLFSYLNAGKYVCIDFFYKDCPYCGTTAPYLQSAFQHFGCNEGDLIVLAISSRDNDATLTTYANANGFAYPMISSATGGGSAVNSTYGISQYPTFILIAPNKNIVERDMWPLANAQALITYISGHGVQAQACTSNIDENSKFEINSYPNPVENVFNVVAPNLNKIQFEIIDILGKVVIMETQNSSNGQFSIDMSNLKSGLYFVRYSSNDEVFGSSKIIKK